MTDPHDRRAELIAAHLADELTTQEHQELESLRIADPSIQQELDSMSDILGLLRNSVPNWSEEEPPATLEPAVRAIPHASRGTEDSRRSRSPMLMLAAAAACFVAGAAVVLGAQAVLDSPPDGPPGTYGAVEPVTFTAAPDSVDVEGALIAHTWGTETVLEIDGMPVGENFTVVLVSEAGQEFESGAFIGSEVPVECRLNAAVMRDEVVRVEIVDPNGERVMSADLPDAIDPESSSQAR